MTAPVETKVTIARVSVTFAAGLELAARAWPLAERDGQLAALAELLRAGQGEDFFLVVARREAAIVGAVLAQLVPGQAAVVWLPQADGSPMGGQLLDHVHEHLAAAGALLAQSLLEATADPEVLQSAGYVAAGQLLYMAAQVDHPRERPALDLEPCSPAGHERLVQVVERTYRGSLDCPVVDGIRPIEAVLAGYRAVGAPRPELWLLLRNRGQDIGCLLMADHPHQDQREIVYLGVVPEARGRGLGRALAQAALAMSREAGRKRLVLAVDGANEPAVAAYRSIGFISWDERALWIRKLSNIHGQ